MKDEKQRYSFLIGERVVLTELLEGDGRNNDPWEKAAVVPGTRGVVQYIGAYGPPEYFVRFESGGLTVRGWYYFSQLAAASAV